MLSKMTLSAYAPQKTTQSLSPQTKQQMPPPIQFGALDGFDKFFNPPKKRKNTGQGEELSLESILDFADQQMNRPGAREIKKLYMTNDPLGDWAETGGGEHFKAGASDVFRLAPGMKLMLPNVANPTAYVQTLNAELARQGCVSRFFVNPDNTFSVETPTNLGPFEPGKSELVDNEQAALAGTIIKTQTPLFMLEHGVETLPDKIDPSIFKSVNF